MVQALLPDLLLHPNPREEGAILPVFYFLLVLSFGAPLAFGRAIVCLNQHTAYSTMRKMTPRANPPSDGCNLKCHLAA